MKCIILGTAVDCPPEPVLTAHETYYGMDAAHWKTLGVMFILAALWGVVSAVWEWLLVGRAARRGQPIISERQSTRGLPRSGQQHLSDRSWHRWISKR